MSNKDDAFHGRNPSTGQIQSMLNKDETQLPDHLLHEGSQEKLRRVNEKNYLLSLDTQIAEYEIQIMVKKAQLKYMEDEEYYKSLHYMDDKSIFYRNLLRQYLENEKVAALTNDQLNRLKLLDYNFATVLTEINKQSRMLGEQIEKLKMDITVLKNTIPAIRERYSDMFGKCFADNANFSAFNQSRIDRLQVYPVGFNRTEAAKRNWSIEIDKVAFCQLGQIIAQALRTQSISNENVNAVIKRETEVFIHNKLDQSLRDLPERHREVIVAQLKQSPEVQGIIQTLVSQVQQHIQYGETSTQLNSLSCEYDNMQAEISKNEELLDTLQQKDALLDKCKEALESASELNQHIMETGKYDPVQLEQLLMQGQTLAKDTIAACDLSGVKLDDPFGEEEHSAPAPRM